MLSSSRPYAPNILSSSHPSTPFSSPRVCVYQYEQTLLSWNLFNHVPQFLPIFLFQQCVEVDFRWGIVQAMTGLIATLSPVNSKPMDISRSSINWWVYTDLRQLVSLTAKPTPYSPCLLSVPSWPEQKLCTSILLQNTLFSQLSLFPAGRRSHSQVAFARTHSNMPILVPHLHSQGSYIVGCYRHKGLLLTRSGLACCKPCQPTLGPTPPSLFSLFSRFCFHDVMIRKSNEVKTLIGFHIRERRYDSHPFIVLVCAP